jgi:CTD small phosphatase-like protein 2
MKPKNNLLDNNSLESESILDESEKISPASNSQITDELKIEKNSKLNLFKQQSSKVCIFPLGNRANFPGNYDRYLETTLTHIAQLNNVNFEYALEDPNITKDVPNFFSKKINFSTSPQKKLLLLDLDETLIHADFDEEYLGNDSFKYDAVIKFNSKNESEVGSIFGENDEMEEKKEEEVEHSVGIFVRNGVNEFLQEVSKHFDVGIYTASVKEYADAVISFLDPENKLIKYRLYRNNCINFNDSFFVKDLRIFKGVDLKDIILIDNSMYSFAAQLSNGILINSFYNDKNDTELYNVMSYLLNYILPEEDIRKVNEQFFNFQQIKNDLMSVNNF